MEQNKTNGLTSKQIETYRKIRRIILDSKGNPNERLTAQKRLLKMEQKYPHIAELADRAEKKEEIEDTFVRPPQPAADASWFTKKLSQLGNWAIDQLQEVQLEVLMNDAFEKGVLSIEEQLDEGMALEAEGFDDEEGEKCVEVVFQIPIGLWQKIVTHQPSQKAFMALLDDMVTQTRD
jgi:hypothetical protein